MKQDEFKVILQRLEHIESVVNDTNKALDADREDIQQFTLRLGSLENQQAQIWKIVNNMPERMKNKMTDVIDPMMEETQELKEAIKNKQFVAIKVKSTNFLQRLANWWKRGWE